jgi:hypothetical protein
MGSINHLILLDGKQTSFSNPRSRPSIPGRAAPVFGTARIVEFSARGLLGYFTSM